MSRLLAALLALWFGGGPAMTALHLALVHHVVCASHGELVHEHQDHVDAGTDAHGQAAVHANDRDDAPPEHLHDHCTSTPSAAPTATTPLASVAPVIAPAAAESVVGSPCAPSPWPGAGRLFSFAPKTSPPFARVAT